MKKKVRFIPFLIVCLILSYTWFIILNTEYQATLKHQIALSIAVVNLIVYIFHFNYGLILTGLLLLLATFNAIGMFPDIVYTSFFMKIAGKEIESPAIQGKSFLLLILYFALSWGHWSDQYRSYKSSKNNSK